MKSIEHITTKIYNYEFMNLISDIVLERNARNVSFLTTYLSTYKTLNHYILLNALTGAVDRVSESVYQRLNNPELLSEEEYQLLLNRGYYFQSRRHELNCLENVYMSTKIKLQETPVSFCICPTYQCNFKCPYCYEGSLTNTKDIMTVAQLDNVFSAIVTLSKELDANAVELELFGGEPLQESTYSLVERILQFSRDINAPVRVVSNGGDIELYASLLFKNRNQISRIVITIDGPPEVHNFRRIDPKTKNSFEKISKSIDILNWIGIPITLNMNIDKKNITFVPWLSKYIRERKWDQYDGFVFSLQPLDDRTMKGNTPNSMSEFELVEFLDSAWNELEEMSGCTDWAAVLMVLPTLAGAFNKLGMREKLKEQPFRRYGHYCWVTTEQATFYFGQDGYIYLCPVGVGIEQLAVGRFEPILELHPETMNIWKGSRLFKNDECFSCRIGPLCGGGCTVTSLLKDPSGDSKDCGDTFQVVDKFMSYAAGSPYVVEN